MGDFMLRRLGMLMEPEPGKSAEVEGELSALDPEVFPPRDEHRALASVDPRNRVIGNFLRFECLFHSSVELHCGGRKVVDGMMPVGNDVRILAEFCHESPLSLIRSSHRGRVEYADNTSTERDATRVRRSRIMRARSLFFPTLGTTRAMGQFRSR